jgi:hypothetical protein
LELVDELEQDIIRLDGPVVQGLKVFELVTRLLGNTYLVFLNLPSSVSIGSAKKRERLEGPWGRNSVQVLT